MESIISTCTEEDLPAVAAVHKREMSTHFLGHYSQGLLCRFYACFLGDCVFLVSRGQEINGFLLGGEAELLRQGMRRFITTATASYVLETALRPRLYFPALRRLGRMRPYLSDRTDEPLETPDILSIAVDTRARGQGIGARLLREFERQLKPDSVYRLSVKRDNQVALKFYLKNGFVIDREQGDGLYLSKRVISTQT